MLLSKSVQIYRVYSIKVSQFSCSACYKHKHRKSSFLQRKSSFLQRKSSFLQCCIKCGIKIDIFLIFP